MILDNNIICYQFDKGQYTPNKVIESGAKSDDVSDDKYSFSTKKSALLVIEEDIINFEGYGLKKGFYNVATDNYMDFLYIYQSGKIKAKLPVIETKVIETLNPIQFKVKKMSSKKAQKEQEKEYRKYLDGTNPKEVVLRSAQIRRLDEVNTWLLIYTENNVELVGLIKF